MISVHVLDAENIPTTDEQQGETVDGIAAEERTRKMILVPVVGTARA